MQIVILNFITPACIFAYAIIMRMHLVCIIIEYDDEMSDSIGSAGGSCFH